MSTAVAARTCRVIGPGRAGGAFARALDAAPGWTVHAPLRRGDDVSAGAADVDLVVIATPDRVIAEVAAAMAPGRAVVAHLSGASGLDVLAPHARRAALHPLMTLPNPEVGARLLVGAWWATAGDPFVGEVVAALAGHAFAVADAERARYHAAACVASNHVVALLAQVERLADAAGVPFAAFGGIVRASVDNAFAIGPRAALTGPAARGDLGTLERHRGAIGDRERPVYDAMVEEIRRLVS